MPIKTYFNWSSGKDASLALYKLLNNPDYKIGTLLTSVNSKFDRITMHGVRRELLSEQANSIGIPLNTIELPEQPSMEAYEEILSNKVSQLKAEGYTNAAFGDIYLEDLKKYREEHLAKVGITCSFPLWKKDTKELLKEMLDLGFKTIIVCVKSELLDKSFVGRIIDEQFILDLPSNVDPCGENGEFHTFCFDGPIFEYPLKFEIGETIFREYEKPKTNTDDVCITDDKLGFWFCDLILK